MRSKIDKFCRFADDLSDLSTCKRLSVGAVLVTPDLREVVAIGYNGQPTGSPNEGCQEDRPGGCGCIHAEANAMVKPRAGGTGLVLFVTHSPCEHCAGLIVNSRSVEAVVYWEEYRSSGGLDTLREAGVLAVRLPRPSLDRRD